MHRVNRYTGKVKIVDRLLCSRHPGPTPAVRHQVDDKLRFLAPFDPVAWDRRRFRLLWAGNTSSRPMYQPTSAAWAIM